MMSVLGLSEEAEFTLIVAWGIVLGGILLNLLSCWLCCCCRTFDGMRRVLAGITAFTLIVALIVTAAYTQDLAQWWPAATAPHRLFNGTERAARVLKKLKWPA